jgi:hypothetical protein
LIRYTAVRLASTQYLVGKWDYARKARPVSITCLCFLSATPFC